MDSRIQILTILVAALLLVGVIVALGRRRLLERYALLWLFSALALVLLTAWSGLLQVAADLIGVAYPPSALFLIAFGFVIVLLLHFSVAVSRLADQSKVLAQRLAMLEEKVARQETADGEEEIHRITRGVS